MPGTTMSLGPKDGLDKFYTKPEVAAACLGALDLSQFTRIIEPSAGAGSFSNLLFADRARRRVLAFDIAPEHRRVKEQDWFEYRSRSRGRTLVVGNPPFGRQGSLALRFINHAFEVVGADTVAFVLPAGFHKDSVKNRVYRNAVLTHEQLLLPCSFTLHGEGYALRSVFQVWERSDDPRPLAQTMLTSKWASFIKKQQKPDLAVRRVGGRAGKADIPTRAHSEQTNYFLRLGNPEGRLRNLPKAQEVVELINGLHFADALVGTGPNSLARSDFVRLFDPAFERAFA